MKNRVTQTEFRTNRRSALVILFSRLRFTEPPRSAIFSHEIKKASASKQHEIVSFHSEIVCLEAHRSLAELVPGGSVCFFSSRSLSDFNALPQRDMDATISASFES